MPALFWVTGKWVLTAAVLIEIEEPHPTLCEQIPLSLSTQDKKLHQKSNQCQVTFAGCSLRPASCGSVQTATDLASLLLFPHLVLGKVT